MNAPSTLFAAPATVVTDADRYLFDLQGFLLLRGVLKLHEINDILGAVRRLEKADYDDSWRAKLKPCHREIAMPTKMHNDTSTRLNGLLRLDPAFDRCIDHPRIQPYLVDFMGYPQLINTWSISKRRGNGILGWHRGQSPMQYFCRVGTVHSAMVNVVWFLTDNGADDGCMCAVPGSHKSDVAKLVSYRLDLRHDGNNFDFQSPEYSGLSLPGSIPITGKAGDVLIFSEALIHGGLTKTTDGTRTNLYFNHLDNLHTVAGREPQNMRFFWLPDHMRERFTPRQREMTVWMENARYEIDE
jgi:hypothetical protein